MKLKLLQVSESSGNGLTEAKDIVASMSEEAKADRELFWVLHLNVQLQVIEKELIAMGILDSCTIHPREVFRKAVILSAHSLITIHNHPSGRAEPSANDKELWNRLEKAGDLLGIPVLDNLIITPNGAYYSSLLRKEMHNDR